MNPNDPTNRLEEYLKQLQSGSTPDEILGPHTPEDNELRSLLMTAAVLRDMQKRVIVPSAAQNRSRARFLAAAGQARDQPTTSLRSWLPRFRFSTALTVAMVVLLCTALLGSGLVSAKSIPGDTLYPVKLAVENARLSFAANEATRLSMEQTFDQERVEESQRVLSIGRAETINFSGFLHRESGESWEAGGISLAFTPEQEAALPGLNHMYVEVAGKPHGELVSVQSINVRMFQISGMIEQMSATQWLVSGVPLYLAPQTTFHFQPQVGDFVFINATRQENGSLMVVQVNQSASENFIYLPPTPDLSPTQTQKQAPAVEPTENQTETSSQVPQSQSLPNEEYIAGAQTISPEAKDITEQPAISHPEASHEPENSTKPTSGDKPGGEKPSGASEHSSSDD